MSVRIVTADVTITWGDSAGDTLVQCGIPGPANSHFIRRGTMLDVPPGSALESALGTANRRAPTAAELAGRLRPLGAGELSTRSAVAVSVQSQPVSDFPVSLSCPTAAAQYPGSP